MTELEKTIKDKEAVVAHGTTSITGKVRRRRTVYSRSHMELLLKTFETNPYPGISVREKLSHLTGVHESRIQVWFQNRRARKNKKITKEEKNRPCDIKWQQFNQISEVGQVSKPESKQFGVEHAEKYEDTYMTYAHSLQSRNQMHMDNLASQQSFSYMWSNQCQPASAVAPSCLQSSFGMTEPQIYPYMKPQMCSSSNIPKATSSLETNGIESKCAGAMPLEPGQDTASEFLFQDILEEFQPCWTEVANDIIGVGDDSLF